LLLIVNECCLDSGQEVVDLWRSGWCHLDWEHEHGLRRQQKAVSDERWNHSVSTNNKSYVWTNGPGSCLSCHSEFKSACSNQLSIMYQLIRFKT